VQEPTPAERAIARRAAEARATVPDLELSAEVEMAASLELCARERCSITAVLVRACALALRAVPRANGAYRDGRFELYSRVNIGLVIATEEAYLIPTVFDADAKSLAALTGEAEQLLSDAGVGRLSPPAFSGATFTLANVGDLGVRRSSIVINPPQAAALAAGAIREVPVAREGTVVASHVMTITLACDHRIMYGAHAARFLTEVSSALERPPDVVRPLGGTPTA
jgi:pyruvate dehydrogenase E2 component (dihydrolipoamide acetyltransferase)